MKAHGALYGEVAKGGAIYETLRDAVRDSCGERRRARAPVGLPRHGDDVARRGAGAARRGSATGRTVPTGGWSIATTPGAVVSDPAAAAAQALSLARGAVATSDGSVLTLWVDTLCVHGDTPGAVPHRDGGRARHWSRSGIDVVAPAHA